MQAEWMPMRFVKLLNKTFKMSEDKAAEGLLFQTYLAIAVFKMKLFIINNVYNIVLSGCYIRDGLNLNSEEIK
jgi:hypothetical protein